MTAIIYAKQRGSGEWGRTSVSILMLVVEM
jgi:hypothetical protein